MGRAFRPGGATALRCLTTSTMSKSRSFSTGLRSQHRLGKFKYRHNYLKLTRKDLVNRSRRERNDEEVAVRSSLDVGYDPEVPADQQALTFGHLVEVYVIGYSVPQPPVIDSDCAPVARQVKVE